ncbi:hypothetical protein EVA_19796 [gut metagenome]|uniref:Uncharacterized protein n=1 Tax=gut metagenome TaxID=749906 RepID=J9BX40_9ZZZZ
MNITNYIPRVYQNMPIQPISEEMMKMIAMNEARQIQEKLTEQEQIQIAFVPLVLIEFAWHYALKAMDLAARDKVGILKKLTKVMRRLREKQLMDWKKDLDEPQINHLRKQAEEALNAISYDLQILYFSVNGEFKKTAPQYPYDEMRTYAIIASLFVDLYEKHNSRSDAMLRRKLIRPQMRGTITPDTVKALRDGMDAFSGTSLTFDRHSANIATAMKVIENRIAESEFEVYKNKK